MCSAAPGSPAIARAHQERSASPSGSAAAIFFRAARVGAAFGSWTQQAAEGFNGIEPLGVARVSDRGLDFDRPPASILRRRRRVGQPSPEADSKGRAIGRCRFGREGVAHGLTFTLRDQRFRGMNPAPSPVVIQNLLEDLPGPGGGLLPPEEDRAARLTPIRLLRFGALCISGALNFESRKYVWKSYLKPTWSYKVVET